MGDLNKKDDLEVASEFNNIPVKLTIELTLGMLHDQVTASIEGGSYGCHSWAKVDVGAHQPGWRNYLTAKLTDRDSKKTYKLSVAALKKGLLILQKKYPHHFAAIVQESGDAITGDALVQCATLGDIVYG